MKKIKEFIKSYFILSKRLLLKKSFAVILLLVPLLVGAVKIAVDNGDSGIVTIAIAMEDENDAVACEIVDSLTTEGSELIRFLKFKTPGEAKESVETGKADAAWILHDRLDERIEKFASHTHANNAFVTIIQRENNMFLNISCEKLNSALFPYISKAMYLEKGADAVDTLSKEELEEIYDSINAEGEDLFEFVYARADNNDKVREDDENSFLISPLRGFLAVMVVLGGVAVAMFYINDEQRGIFDRFPRSAGFSFSVSYHAAAVNMVTLVMLVAIFVMKISRGIWYEFLSAAIYSVAVLGFCMLLRLIIRDIRFFGTIAPVLIIVTVVVCPIFYMAPDLPQIQYLIPSYYYLCSASNSTFLWYMAAYGASTLLISFLLHRFSRQRKR